MRRAVDAHLIAKRTSLKKCPHCGQFDFWFIAVDVEDIISDEVIIEDHDGEVDYEKSIKEQIDAIPISWIIASEIEYNIDDFKLVCHCGARFDASSINQLIDKWNTRTGE